MYTRTRTGMTARFSIFYFYNDINLANQYGVPTCGIECLLDIATNLGVNLSSRCWMYMTLLKQLLGIYKSRGSLYCRTLVNSYCTFTAETTTHQNGCNRLIGPPAILPNTQ